MQLFTTVPVQSAVLSLNYNTQFALLGSCFAENIGSRLQRYKFKTLVNPFGILYNPLSIANSFNHIFNRKQFTEADVHLLNDQWFSFHHHTQLNSDTKETHLSKLNNIVEESLQFLQTTDVLIITFGSAYTYQFIESGEIVANCQKVPNHFFKKSRSTVKQIIEVYEVLLKQLFSLNEELKIIFTVSPVRHIKDGIIENQQSKATLILAIDYLTQLFKDKVHYFPAYEIMLDELRDYRFYNSDLLHPNETAIQYIWDAFCTAYLNEKASTTIENLDKLLKQVHHKPFNAASQKHRKATQLLIERLEVFQKNHQVNLSVEMDLLMHQLE